MKGKILVIDDEKLICWSLQKDLTKEGYEVLTAQSASEGLRLFEQEAADVVLLDIRLPDGDCQEILNTMRRKDPLVSVVMITANDDVRTAVQCMRSGAFTYIHKPFEFEELRLNIEKAVEERKTVVLLVDEGQKLNSLSLEVLRMLLNYETNEFKLLQLVIMAQMELLPKLKEMKNFWDRLSLKYVLNPFDEKETGEMIDFRLTAAGYDSNVEFFTDEAVKEIYQYTHGYPRQIAMLCHNALKTLVMENKYKVDGSIIRDLVAKEVKITA